MDVADIAALLYAICETALAELRGVGEWKWKWKWKSLPDCIDYANSLRAAASMLFSISAASPDRNDRLIWLAPAWRS